jgi:hypothetical protein
VCGTDFYSLNFTVEGDKIMENSTKSPLKLARAKAVAEVAARDDAKAAAQRQELETAVSAMADADVGKTFPQTPVITGQIDVAKTTDDAFDAEKAIEEIDAELEKVMPRFIEHRNAAIRCFETEIFPLLVRAKRVLPHGEWEGWYEAFRTKWGVEKSLRSVQRMFKALKNDSEQEIDDAPQEETETEEDETVSAAPDDSLKELLTKRLKELHTVLSEGKSPVDANPLRDGERRISDALALVESTQLALDEGLLDGECREPETNSITPTLTPREIPSLASPHSEHAAVYHAARAAAISAANAVEVTNIEARFYPVLIFLTDRKSVTFGRYLKSQGIKKGGPHGEKWRGKTCFNLPGGEPYRTYEEAWAYARAFSTALPGLDICYGVDMVCMGEDYYGRQETQTRRITQCNAPEPSHGG